MNEVEMLYMNEWNERTNEIYIYYFLNSNMKYNMLTV